PPRAHPPLARPPRPRPPKARRVRSRLAGRAGRPPFEPLGGPRFTTDRAVLAVAQRVVGLDEGVELARALVDDPGLRVAQVALDGEFVAVSVRAVDLDRVQGGLDRVLGRVPLGQARLAGVARAVILEPARPPDEQAADLGPLGHVRDHLLDELVMADLLAERRALVGVAEARVEAGLGEAD